MSVGYRKTVSRAEIQEASRMERTPNGMVRYGEWLSAMGDMGKAARTLKNYGAAAKNLLDFMQMSGYETLDYDVKCEWRRWQTSQVKKGEAKLSTVNLRIVCLNKMFQHLSMEPRMQMRQLKEQEATTLENVLTLSEYNTLVEACDKLTTESRMEHDNDVTLKKQGKLKGRVRRARDYSREKAIMQTLYGTGIRISELEYLTYESLEKGMFKVTNKGKTRTVPITDTLRELLSAFCKHEGVSTGVIFTNSKGSPIPASTVRDALQKVAEAAGVPKEKCHPHSFRHLFGKTMEAKGMPISQISFILGHSNINTTVKYYQRPTMEELRGSLEFYMSQDGTAPQ